MKYIFIAISLLFTLTPIHSQMEFEEVLQLYPEGGGFTYGNEIYLNGDSIYVVSSYSSETRGFFLSTNGGEAWENLLLREKLRLSDDTPNYSAFNPYKFHFIEINYDSSIFSIYNFDGDLVSKNNFDLRLSRGGIIFNPIDPKFIGISRKSYNATFNIYDDSFFYTNDYGSSWYQLDAYNLARDYSGIGLFPQKEIQFLRNVRNPVKSIFRLIWHNRITSIYHFTMNYNFHTHEARFYKDNLQYYHSDYGTYDEDEVVRVTERDSIIHLNVETGEKYGYSRLDATMGWDPDSIAQNNDDGNPVQYSQILKLDKFKINPTNPDHQVVMYKHSEKIDGQEPPMSYIDQYIFQSFDAGKTWESVAQSFDKFKPIVDIYINPKDATLWIKKNDKHTALYSNANDHYSVLYKSTSPLTTVSEIESQVNNVSAFFSGNSLVIDSEELVGDASVELFNIEGRKVMDTNQYIKIGRNEININANIASGLYLVRIKTREKETIVKLIRSK